ncbi:MAG: AAA family ATPase [Ardenticatenaceae bacterium]|nr:AAA family ATPase [Ardenticatenaceae bacterium]
MRISYICIENFRNFKKCEVNLGQNIILIGENKAGKSNFITALRLVLDPLQNRQLTADDFWGGSGYPFDGRSIQVTVRITDFGGKKPDLVPLTWLSSCLIEQDPPVAQLTYLFYPDVNVNEKDQQQVPKQYTEDDYKWKIYPKDDAEGRISLSGMWQDMPLNFINALRDIAGDSNVWSRSPLNELIKLSDDISPEKIQPYADKIANTSQSMVNDLLQTLGEEINSELIDMVGKLYSVDPRLGLDITNPDAIVKALRVFVDGDQNRPISRTSLGLQNAIYLSLLSLQLDKRLKRRAGRNKHYLPIVTLEEPEAHLHPHLQRLVFKNFLDKARARNLPVIISSHSPYLVSAADIADLVRLKDEKKTGGTASSAFEFLKTLEDRDRKDLSRFLDITKSEMVFAKAVLFVEGDVEILLVKTFMDVLGIDFDEYGISVCNVYGVNFYHVAMLAVKLGIPFAVLTDGDKFNPVNGLQRGINLAKVFENGNEIKNALQEQYDNKTVDNDVVRKELANLGVFVNDWTLEPTLIEAGLAEELKLTFQELGDELGQNVRAGSNHIDGYLANPTDENMRNILTAINDTRWGKGRFAHRLCTHILTMAEANEEGKKQRIVPAYMVDAVDYLIKQVTPQDIDEAGENVE